MEPSNIPSWQVDARLADERNALQRKLRSVENMNQVLVALICGVFGFALGFGALWIIATKGGVI